MHRGRAALKASLSEGCVVALEGDTVPCQRKQDDSCKPEGRADESLDGRGKNVGIDLSEGMLAKAKARARQHAEAEYQLSLGSALDLPVESDSIDLLINTYMFDLLSEKDMAKALSEFVRVLRPGGRIVLVNMAHGRT